jgi:hypothetical protein
MNIAVAQPRPISVPPGRRAGFARRMGYPPAWRWRLARSVRWTIAIAPVALLLAGVVR